MKRLSAALITLSLALTSASALAAPSLTQAECHDYPFTPLKHTVTHKQLMQELSELEAVGYQPTSDDNEYPDQLQTAESKLHQEYRRDCVQAQVAGNPASSSAN
ncbi:DUF4148 domain-containing protein [Caballeronia sp. 15715]|uniref:DUF4148 domain-containing protein n=1 Tax=unclassified Caballeronia TaxID=2646786 RepID=UPI0039E2ABE0